MQATIVCSVFTDRWPKAKLKIANFEPVVFRRAAGCELVRIRFLHESFMRAWCHLSCATLKFFRYISVRCGRNIFLLTRWASKHGEFVKHRYADDQ
jgi:hypothetical protein